MKALIVVIALLLSGCGLCGEHVSQVLLSPDGIAVASVVVRDCGATTSEYSHVRLRDRRSWFGLSETTVLITKYRQDMTLSWKDHNHLSIVCPSCNGKTLLESKKQWHGVEITFVPLGN